jgi:hypothetical protein
MDSHVVFARTAKGDEELKLRSHQLSHRHRLALILVNGKADVATLYEKARSLANLEDLLEDLSARGFIHASNAQWTPSSGSAAPDEGPLSFDVARERMIETTAMVLGKHADRVVAKLRDAVPTADGLADAARQAEKVTALFIDERKAAELGRKLGEVLAATVAAPESGKVVTMTTAADTRIASARAQLIEIAGRTLSIDAHQVIKKLRSAPDTREGLEQAVAQGRKLIALFFDEEKAARFRDACAQVLKTL